MLIDIEAEGNVRRRHSGPIRGRREWRDRHQQPGRFVSRLSSEFYFHTLISPIYTVLISTCDIKLTTNKNSWHPCPTAVPWSSSSATWKANYSPSPHSALIWAPCTPTFSIASNCCSNTVWLLRILQTNRSAVHSDSPRRTQETAQPQQQQQEQQQQQTSNEVVSALPPADLTPAQLNWLSEYLNNVSYN